MAKKSKQPTLGGIQWGKYKGEHPIGIAPGDWDKVRVGPPEEPEGTNEHYYGYHSTPVGPERILKEGLKASNPLAGADFDEPISPEEHEAATGVYFHGTPHTEYGENLYRMTIPRGTPVSGDFDRMGEGENTLEDVPAKDVAYVGHGIHGGGREMADFHSTQLPPEKCPACIIDGLHYEMLASRNASKQFPHAWPGRSLVNFGKKGRGA
jgi:hypothetical protein